MASERIQRRIEAGFRPELGFTLSDYADLLLDEAQSVGAHGLAPRPEAAQALREKATGRLSEALSLGEDLGMRPRMGRVLARREILKA